MDPIVTTEIPVPIAQREPTDAEVQAARDVLAQLEAEARALGRTKAGAPVHYAMGRIFVEQLGDQRSAATCYQNAFLLNPNYRPTLEAARRLFASAGRYEKTLALHQREAELLADPAPRAESLRAQALVLRELGREEEAKKLIGEALQLAPEHPALLKASVAAAQREGDRLLCARLLMRSAGVTRDPVYKAQLLRRAVLRKRRRLRPSSRHAPAPPSWPRSTRRRSASSTRPTPTTRSASSGCCSARAPATTGKRCCASAGSAPSGPATPPSAGWSPPSPRTASGASPKDSPR